MPRIRQKSSEYIGADFTHAVKVHLVSQNMEQKDLADALGISQSQMSILLRNPGKLTMSRLQKMTEVLHLTPEEVLLFAGFPKKITQGVGV